MLVDAISQTRACRHGLADTVLQTPTSWEGSPIATIDSLLSKVDSKYSLVHLAARRAREINDYYHSLGEGLGQYTPPLVEHVDSNKPLSIAMEEIAAEKIVIQYPGDARRAADEALQGEGGIGGALGQWDADASEAAGGTPVTAEQSQRPTGEARVVSLDSADEDV